MNWWANARTAPALGSPPSHDTTELKRVQRSDSGRNRESVSRHFSVPHHGFRLPVTSAREHAPCWLQPLFLFVLPECGARERLRGGRRASSSWRPASGGQAARRPSPFFRRSPPRRRVGSTALVLAAAAAGGGRRRRPARRLDRSHAQERAEHLIPQKRRERERERIRVWRHLDASTNGARRSHRARDRARGKKRPLERRADGYMSMMRHESRDWCVFVSRVYQRKKRPLAGILCSSRGATPRKKPPAPSTRQMSAATLSSRSGAAPPAAAPPPPAESVTCSDDVVVCQDRVCLFPLSVHHVATTCRRRVRIGSVCSVCSPRTIVAMACRRRVRIGSVC